MPSAATVQAPYFIYMNKPFQLQNRSPKLEKTRWRWQGLQYRCIFFHDMQLTRAMRTSLQHSIWLGLFFSGEPESRSFVMERVPNCLAIGFCSSWMKSIPMKLTRSSPTHHWNDQATPNTPLIIRVTYGAKWATGFLNIKNKIILITHYIKLRHCFDFENILYFISMIL